MDTLSIAKSSSRTADCDKTLRHSDTLYIKLSGSLLWVLEDELSQFQVAQNDARLMAVCNPRHNLLEQTSRIRISKTTSCSHVRVQVAVVSCKECIHTRCSNDDLMQLDNTIM